MSRKPDHLLATYLIGTEQFLSLLKRSVVGRKGGVEANQFVKGGT